MAVGSAILPARYVYPEVLAVGGLHDELVKVAIVLQPVEPLVGSLKVRGSGDGSLIRSVTMQ